MLAQNLARPMKLALCAQFHEAVAAVNTTVIRSIYGRSYGRNSFMKLGTDRITPHAKRT